MFAAELVKLTCSPPICSRMQPVVLLLTLLPEVSMCHAHQMNTHSSNPDEYSAPPVTAPRGATCIADLVEAGLRMQLVVHRFVVAVHWFVMLPMKLCPCRQQNERSCAAYTLQVWSWCNKFQPPRGVKDWNGTACLLHEFGRSAGCHATNQFVYLALCLTGSCGSYMT